MAAKPEESGQEDESGLFEWDEASQLYFHASSGFYHDPDAGWYYSTRDGRYYKFDNGSYVLIESDKGEIHSDEAILDRHDSLDNAAHELFKPTRTENDATCEIEEGEWIEGNLQEAGASWDEENWRAQYGQVVQSQEESLPASSIIDLWDWAMVTETVLKKKRGKKKKQKIARMVGKLVKPSATLHPSMPSGGRLLKTASICEAHLALVRVSSGQVYRLRSPSLKYLSSLSVYDSSNPTKEWGFPDISVDQEGNHINKFGESCEGEASAVPAESAALPDQQMILEKLSLCNLSVSSSSSPSSSSSSSLVHKASTKAGSENKGIEYRDRAAERRALHGRFGLGHGQKIPGSDSEPETSLVSDSTEEAAAEALHMSFGAGSFARRVLQNMGWKEGEALGKTTKGFVGPLQAVGNKGFAGIGWNQHRPDHR